MKTKLWIKNISIHRTPGFSLQEFPPLRNLSEGLQIIWGPNGIGKSSLARALRGLLWKSEDTGGVEAEGDLFAGEEQYSLSLSQGSLQQLRLRDNEQVKLPGRADEQAANYWFPLHELLQVDERGADFLHIVQREMQGGVDLEKALAAAGGKPQFTNSNCIEVKEVKKCKDQLQAAKRKQQENRDLSDTIAQLRNKLENREQLEREQAAVRHAITLQEQQSRLAALDTELQGYPACMEHLHEDDPDVFSRLKQYYEKQQADCKKLQDDISRQHKDLSLCSITPRQLDDAALPDLITGSAVALEQSARQLERAENQLEGKKRAVQQWEQQHDWLLPQPPEAGTLAGSVELLKQLANSCEPLRCALAAKQRYAESLGELQQEGPDRARQIFSLENWLDAELALAATPQELPRTGRVKGIAVLSTLGISGLAAAGALFIHPASLALLAALPVVIWFLLSRKQGEADSMYALAVSKRDQAYAQMLEALGDFPHYQALLQEQTGRLAAARELLEEILQTAAENRSIKQQNEKRVLAQQELERAEKALDTWRLDWQKAALALGISAANPQLEGAQFFHFSVHLEQWMKLLSELSEAEAGYTLALRDFNTAREELQQLLGTEETSVTLLLAAAKNLQQRLIDAKRITRTIEKLEIDLQDAQAAVREREQEIEAFWQQRDIASRDFFELRRLAEQYPKWRSLMQEQAQTQRSVEALMQESSKYMSIVTDNSEFLPERLQKIEEALKQLESVARELGSLEQQYETLISGEELAKAQAEYQAAIEALERLRQRDVEAVAVYTIAQFLKQQAEREERPEVLRLAGDWLKKITQARYELFANGAGLFARDVVKGMNLTLDQLSSATRVQLLFSIRMACIELQEAATRIAYPIFLDEVLANSDSARARAIASAIHEIAKTRQVFYFTAQHEEVEKLSESSVEGEQISSIHLSSVGELEALSKHPSPRYEEELLTIPKPVADYNQYAELCKAAGPELWKPVSQLHTWFLCMNSDELYWFLQKGYAQIGQAAFGMDNRADVKSLPSNIPSPKELAARVSYLQRAQAYAQTGRCKILSPAALQADDIPVNTKADYWSKTVAFVQEQTVSGNDVLEAIEKKQLTGFREPAKTNFTQWLLAHEFASEEAPLSRQEILEKLSRDYPEVAVDSVEFFIVKRWLELVGIA